MNKCDCIKWSTSIFQCWSFVVTISISIFALTVSVVGLAGVFPPFEGDRGFYGGLIGTVIGLWFPRPTIQSHISELKLAEGTNDRVVNMQQVFVDGQE